MVDQIQISSKDLFKLSLEKANIGSSYNPIIIEDSQDPAFSAIFSQDRVLSEPQVLELNQVVQSQTQLQNHENMNIQNQKLDITFNQYAENRINQSISQYSQQIEPQENYFSQNSNCNMQQQNQEAIVEEICSSPTNVKILQPKNQNLNLQLTDTYSRLFTQTLKSYENYIENALSPQDQRFNQFMNMENAEKIESGLNKVIDQGLFRKEGQERQNILKLQVQNKKFERNEEIFNPKQKVQGNEKQEMENFSSQESNLRFQTQSSSTLKNFSSQENIMKSIQNSATEETKVAYELLQRTLFSQKSKSKTSRGVFSPSKQSLDQQYLELLRRPSSHLSQNQNSSCYSNSNQSLKQPHLNNFTSSIRIEQNDYKSKQNYTASGNNTSQFYLSPQPPSDQILSARIDRLAYEHLVLQDSKQRLREKYIKSELKECTFQPNLSQSRSKSKNNLFDSNTKLAQSFYPKEQVQEFLKKQEVIQKKYESQQKQMKEEQDQKIKSTIKSKPTLNKKSQILAREVNKENYNVVERLYSSSSYQSQRATPNKQRVTPNKLRKDSNNLRDKSRENTYQDQNMSKKGDLFFQPQISERAHNIMRNQRVDILLYEDAQRRQKYQEDQKSRSISKSSQAYTTNCSTNNNNNFNSTCLIQPNLFASKIQAQSQNNLILGFLKEFESSFKQSQDESEMYSDSPKTLLFIEMVQILKILRFISISTYDTNTQCKLNILIQINNLLCQNLSKDIEICTQIWNYLKGDLKGYILKRNLQLFLLAVMNIFDKRGIIPKLEKENISNVLQNHVSNPKQNLDIKVIEDFQTQNSIFSSQSYERCGFSQYTLSQDTQSFNKTHRFQSIKIETTFDEVGNLTLSQEEVYYIHQKYQILYNNRLSTKKHTNSQESTGQNQIRSKSPRLISQTSDYLAQKKRQKLIEEIVQKEPQVKKIDLTSLLNYQQEKTNIEIQQLRYKNIQEELSNCTFKPQLIQSPLVKQFL